MKQYEVFQNHKLDPKVFPDETTTRRSPHDAEYISWYGQQRLHYYASRGRLSDLRALEKVKYWPNMPNTMTSVSRTKLEEKLDIF